MAREAEKGGRHGNVWRMAGWGCAALLLLAPLVAMQVTDEVNWTAGDFVFAAVLILGVGGTYEAAVWMTTSAAYRAAAGVALAGVFLLVWINLAVGIIGNEDNPANLMYGALLALGIVGALASRSRPAGMARVMCAAAAIQIAIGAVAVGADLGSNGPAWPRDVLALTASFTTLWLVSAGLFRKAAAERPPASAAS